MLKRRKKYEENKQEIKGKKKNKGKKEKSL